MTTHHPYRIAITFLIADPITVTGFHDVGAVSLKLTYNSSILVYQDNFTPHVSFPGMIVGEESPGVIKISWQGNTIASLPDNTEIIALDFTSITGASQSSGIVGNDQQVTIVVPADVAARFFRLNVLVE